MIESIFIKASHNWDCLLHKLYKHIATTRVYLFIVKAYATNFNELDLLIGVAAGYGGFFFPDDGFGEGLETASVGLYDYPFQPQDFPKIIFLRSTFFGYLGDCSGSSCDFGPESLGQVTYELGSSSTSIPEPGTVGSLLVFGLGSLLLKKKTVSSKSES